MESVSKEVDSDVPARMQSAAQTLKSLDEEVLQWTNAHPMTCGVKIVAATPGILGIFGVPAQAPVDKWALRLGHGVHDLRAALDHLAQILARIEGDEPANPKGVYFPACETEVDWNNKKKALATVPASILSRLEAIQPFKSNDVLARGLRLLHRIDIQDKHYHLASLQPIISQFSLDEIKDWPDAAVDDELWDAPMMSVQLNESLPSDTVGLMGLTEVPVTPLLEVGGEFAVMLDVQRWLYAVIDALVGFVATGAPVPELPPEPDWFSK